MHELECRDLRGRLTDYLEGSLDPDELVGLAAHLDACADCRTYARQFEVMLGLMARLPIEYISEVLESSLLVGYREWLLGVTV